MKKLLVNATLLSVLMAAPAFAKTQGNYVGINLLRTHVERDSARSNDANSAGFGINYKYAFNYNNFFVAPGIFVDDNMATVNYHNNTETRLTYSYGARLDLGYDLDDKTAIYVNAGLIDVNYSANNGSSGKHSGTDMAGIYGFGVKHSVTENIDVSFGYEVFGFKTKNPKASGVAKTAYNVDTIKIGASYKF